MIHNRVSDHSVLAAHKDCTPGHLQKAAAHLAVKRRQAAEEAGRLRAAHPVNIDVSMMKKGPYLGQMVLKTDAGMK